MVARRPYRPRNRGPPSILALDGERAERGLAFRSIGSAIGIDRWIGRKKTEERDLTNQRECAMIEMRIGRFGGLLFLGSRRTQLYNLGNQPSIGGLTSSVAYPQTVAPVEGFVMASGIYQIKNHLDGKRYVGSAVSFQKRWQNHLSALRRGQHDNHHLQHAFDKYGKSAFIFSVLERVEDTSQLIPREQHHIDMLNPEYNISPIAGSTLGRRHSLETRRKISEATKGRFFSEETRRKLSEALMGRWLSEEHRRNLIGERNHNYGKHRSEETRKKISVTQRGKHVSAKSRRKMSESHKGKRHSEETKRKMSDAQTRRRHREKEAR